MSAWVKEVWMPQNLWEAVGPHYRPTCLNITLSNFPDLLCQICKIQGIHVQNKYSGGREGGQSITSVETLLQKLSKVGMEKLAIGIKLATHE